MKVTIIGANGQLGSDLCKVYLERGYAVSGLNHNRLDIDLYQSCHDCLTETRPDLVINTAAQHDVERCEKNPSRAFEVNGLGARNLALLSNELGFVLVHVSTDYVFDGAKKEPYVEKDSPLPLNVYGNTKLSGELFVRAIAQRYFVVRVSGLYGLSPCRAKGGLNFVQLMLKLAAERDEVRVVADEVLTPTYTRDIAEQLEELTRTDNYGLYHMTAQGSCSWYEFAEKIFELTPGRAKLSVASPGEFPAKVSRPKYSVLENAALKALGLNRMPHWSDGLQRYLQEISINL
jgi:dTDP-4-dehydrorhamnose reductase